MADEKSSTETLPRPRIQTLSDLIFGLALSIGSLNLISQKPTSLIEITTSLAYFGFTFYILANVWVRYTRIMSVLPAETGAVLAINIALLFFVSIEPYLYNLMIGSSNTPTPGQLYLGTTTSLFAADMGSIMLILAYFSYQLTIEERKLIPKELVRNYRLLTYANIVTASLFFVSIFPIFWSFTVLGVQSRFLIWTGFVVVINIRRFEERRKKD